MKKSLFFIAFCLSGLFSSVAQEVTFDEKLNLPSGIQKASKPVVDRKGKGSINWTQQFVEARGTGIINNERWKNPAQARVAAQRAAVVDAQRNLLEIVKGVNVSSETEVKDLMLESDVVKTKVDGIVKGAEQIGEAVEKDGAVTVTLRMPLYADNGLAEAVYDAVPDAGGQTEKQEEPIQESKPDYSGSARAASGNAGDNPEGKQLALNFLNTKKVDPQLFPVVYDEKGNVVLDMKKVYDPTKGKFPQWLATGRNVMKQVGFNKGVEVIDVIQNADGKITLANTNRNKTWQKIGNTAMKVGKFLLALVL